MKDTVAYTLEKGRPLTATIPATAGNVQYNLTPGAGYCIRILYGSIILVCSAAVANRYITAHVQTAGGVDISYNFTAGPTVASATAYLTINPQDSVATGTGVTFVEILGDLRIFDTDRLNITITAGVAGDSYSGYIKYLLVKR